MNSDVEQTLKDIEELIAQWREGLLTTGELFNKIVTECIKHLGPA